MFSLNFLFVNIAFHQSILSDVSLNMNSVQRKNHTLYKNMASLRAVSVHVSPVGICLCCLKFVTTRDDIKFDFPRKHIFYLFNTRLAIMFPFI